MTGPVEHPLNSVLGCVRQSAQCSSMRLRNVEIGSGTFRIVRLSFYRVAFLPPPSLSFSFISFSLSSFFPSFFFFLLFFFLLISFPLSVSRYPFPRSVSLSSFVRKKQRVLLWMERGEGGGKNGWSIIIIVVVKAGCEGCTMQPQEEVWASRGASRNAYY